MQPGRWFIGKAESGDNAEKCPSDRGRAQRPLSDRELVAAAGGACGGGGGRVQVQDFHFNKRT
jgi:hypothetical protein